MGVNIRIKEKSSVRSRRRYRGVIGRFFGNMLLSLLALLGVITLCIVLLVGYYMTQNISAELNEEVLAQQSYVGPSQLYYYDFSDRAARQGERLALDGGTLDGGMLCIPVQYEELPRHLIDAFVAVEDKRFWQHHGVDFLRTAEAGINYFTGREGRFGASTITQQLIKNLTGENDISIRRKVQEMCWANALENQWSKQEIMERYLNVINLARGCYGVGAAAQSYFDKSVSELTLAECATIAAITNNPSYYDPVRFPAHTEARRNLILNRMVEQGYISEEEAREATATPMEVIVRSRDDLDAVRSWYVDMVVEDVVDDLCERLGYSRERANRMIWSGGLQIETAIDTKMQQKVEKYYQELDNFPIHANGERAQSAIVVMEPQTGDILAVAGAVGEKGGNRLRSYATDARRPAASAIKPLSVYAPALEMNKITWASVYDDVPISFGKYNLNRANGPIVKPIAWPKNATRIYRGLTDIRYAVSHSVNTVSVRVLREIGAERSFDFLRNTLHMNSLIESKTLDNGRTLTDCGEAALALGQMNYGVTLRELTAAYSMVANGGVYVEPHAYYRVIAADGTVLLSNPIRTTTAISEQNACIMTKLLQNVVTQGTGKGATIEGVEVAGKTGTSSADYDKWFIGYTPRILAGVWYGFEYPAALSDVKGNPAVRIWQENVSVLHKLSEQQEGKLRRFPLAPGIIRVSYCQDSGDLPTDACRMDLRGDRCATGYFVQGTEPGKKCSCHVLREYDTQAQRLADENTPAEVRRTVGLLQPMVHRDFPGRIYVADERYFALR
ncbi:MAG: transglycosylase domain-containing protein [Clostridia bacterium]|nr:transglycosylase domain-containing protein [Clostridia bacterium]